MSTTEKQPGGAVIYQRRSCAAFTLTEIMVSMAILGLIMVMLFSIFEQVNKAWLNGENRVETFTQARAIQDLMSRELSQAIATPKISFFGDPTRIYFVAPVNTAPANQADLCEVGYEFERVASADPTKWTLKIVRHFIGPTSGNMNDGSWNIYNPTWWTSFNGLDDTIGVLATNSVVGVTIQYADANGNLSTTWANPNKLPSSISIDITNVDSRTAVRIQQFTPTTLPSTITNSTLRSFTTSIYLPITSP